MKSRNEVGGIYKKELPSDHYQDLKNILAGAVGLFGIFFFFAALALLPWWVL